MVTKYYLTKMDVWQFRQIVEQYFAIDEKHELSSEMTSSGYSFKYRRLVQPKLFGACIEGSYYRKNGFSLAEICYDEQGMFKGLKIVFYIMLSVLVGYLAGFTENKLPSVIILLFNSYAIVFDSFFNFARQRFTRYIKKSTVESFKQIGKRKYNKLFDQENNFVPTSL